MESGSLEVPMKNNSKKEDLQFDTIEILDLNEEDSKTDFKSNADAITKLNADIEKYDSQSKKRNLQTQEEYDKLKETEESEEIEQLEKEETKVNSKKEFLSTILMFVIGIGVALFLKNFIIINAKVPTGSMENTIQINDNLFGYRLAYLKEEPERGDIIFFYYPDNETQKYVKRIIVMNQGKVMFDDVPKEVFKNYKELEAIGLAAPQVTYLMHELKDRGLNVDTDVTTIEEARAAILEALLGNP